MLSIFDKTSVYLDIFARFKAKENIEAVEQMLASRTELVYFERSQLGIHPLTLAFCRHDAIAILNADGALTGSLCCETAEEAKLLIPSLQDKIADEDLQDLLDNIMRLRVDEN